MRGGRAERDGFHSGPYKSSRFARSPNPVALRASTFPRHGGRKQPTSRDLEHRDLLRNAAQFAFRRRRRDATIRERASRFVVADDRRGRKNRGTRRQDLQARGDVDDLAEIVLPLVEHHGRARPFVPADFQDQTAGEASQWFPGMIKRRPPLIVAVRRLTMYRISQDDFPSVPTPACDTAVRARRGSVCAHSPIGIGVAGNPCAIADLLIVDAS